MSILILNRNAPYPFESWLDSLNEDLLVLTTEKRSKEIDFPVVKGFKNYEENGLIEISAAELFNKYGYHTVISTSEYDVYRAAKIREYLGITGQNVDSALAFRDKVIMKQYLKDHGINVPSFQKIDSAIDLYNFAEENGYPIIVKPRDGSGSEGVHKLATLEELKRFVENHQLNNLEVESFVEGDMYHIDGLYLQREVVFSWPSKYINGCLSHKNEGYNGSYLLGEHNPLTPRLNTFISKVIQALPSPDHMAFHAEVFVTPDNQLVFCEIACRRGGGYIAETIDQAFGIDLTKLSVQSQCGINVSLPKNIDKPSIQSGFLLIPCRNGEIVEIPKEFPQEWITKYDIYGKQGDRFTAAESSLDIVASFLVKGDSEVQVQQRINELAKWFEFNTKWNVSEILV